MYAPPESQSALCLSKFDVMREIRIRYGIVLESLNRRVAFPDMMHEMHEVMKSNKESQSTLRPLIFLSHP